MSTMVCSKCGTALGVGAKVCPSCGQSVSAPRPAPAAPPKRTPLAAIAILGGGLVVLLAVVTLYRAGFLSGLLGTGAPVATPAANAAPPAPAVVPAAAVSESVAELPDYPGAIRVALTQGAAEHGYARKLEANWTSADPFATVVAFYQKEIAGRGWTITGTESKATEIEWKLAKGTSVAKVEVKQGVPVTIKIERSDR